MTDDPIGWSCLDRVDSINKRGRFGGTTIKTTNGFSSEVQAHMYFWQSFWMIAKSCIINERVYPVCICVCMNVIPFEGNNSVACSCLSLSHTQFNRLGSSKERKEKKDVSVGGVISLLRLEYMSRWNSWQERNALRELLWEMHWEDDSDKWWETCVMQQQKSSSLIHPLILTLHTKRVSVKNQFWGSLNVFCGLLPTAFHAATRPFLMINCPADTPHTPMQPIYYTLKDDT